MCPAEIYRNNMFGGTVFSFYGGLWLSYGLWGVLVGGTVLSAPHEYIKGLQMFIILWGELPYFPSLPAKYLRTVC